MKKAIAIFTVLVICLAIMVGCGSQTATSAVVSTADSAKTESVSSVPASSEVVSSVAASSEAEEERPECDKEFRLELTDGSTYADGDTIVWNDITTEIINNNPKWSIDGCWIDNEAKLTMGNKKEATLKIRIFYWAEEGTYEHEYHLVAAE